MTNLGSKRMILSTLSLSTLTEYIKNVGLFVFRNSESREIIKKQSENSFAGHPVNMIYKSKCFSVQLEISIIGDFIMF